MVEANEATWHIKRSVFPNLKLITEYFINNNSSDSGNSNMPKRTHSVLILNKILIIHM